VEANLKYLVRDRLGRPLVSGSEDERTSVLSRDHTILVTFSGLITITDGKWTTYHKMAKDKVNQFSQLTHAQRISSRAMPSFRYLLIGNLPFGLSSSRWTTPSGLFILPSGETLW
jgi:hypothetical protein